MWVLKKELLLLERHTYVNSRLLTHRILARISLNNNTQDTREIFNFKIFILPTSLFDHSTQWMRKTNKSTLSHSLWNAWMHRSDLIPSKLLTTFLMVMYLFPCYHKIRFCSLWRYHNAVRILSQIWKREQGMGKGQ